MLRVGFLRILVLLLLTNTSSATEHLAMINLEQNLFAEISELQSGRVGLVEFLSEGCNITRPTSYSLQYIKNRLWVVI